MPNVVVIAKDEKVRRQVETHLAEVGVDSLRFSTFHSESEFEELYFRQRTIADTSGAEVTQLKLFSEINLLIFALDTITGPVGPWIDRLRANLQKLKQMPLNGALRLMLLKYEDDGVNKLDLMHPRLDDLVYLPLDRLVLLQKLQIWLTLPRTTTPKFLFNQEIKQEMEISKLTKLECLSDVGLAIRNPLPLRRGLPAHFYVNLPDSKERLELHAKVLRSEAHPDATGQALIYFTYFGLPRAALTQIRLSLSKAANYSSLLIDDRQRVSFKPDNLFNTDEDRKQFGAMVIDSDELNGRGLATTMQKEMDRLTVKSESSYQMFLYRYLATEKAPEEMPTRGTDVGDFYYTPIRMTVATKNLHCLSVEPGPPGDSQVLGHSAHDVFASPEGWLKLVTEPETRSLLEESIHLANNGRVLDKVLVFQDAEGQRRAVRVKTARGAIDGTAQVDFAPANASEAPRDAHDASFRLNALVVDTHFVPDDVNAWIEGLRTRALEVGLVADPADLKFWLIADHEQIRPQWLKHPDILGLFTRPVDVRQLMFSLSEHLVNKNTLYHFENLSWAEPNISIHLAKEMKLEALSEFGATLHSPQKLIPGTILFLRGSIYDNAPNGCLAARVYACEEHAEEKGTFRILTMYFGINDAFLKFARTWIRENYAQRKAK